MARGRDEEGYASWYQFTLGMGKTKIKNKVSTLES